VWYYYSEYMGLCELEQILDYVPKFFFVWRNSPQWARASSFMRFLDHTQRRTTVGRTPLDE